MQLAMTMTAKAPQSGVVKTRLVPPLEVGLPEWPYDARRHALEKEVVGGEPVRRCDVLATALR